MWTFYEIFGNLKIKNQEEGIINKKRKKWTGPFSCSLLSSMRLVDVT